MLIHLVHVRIVDDEVSNADELVMEEILSDVRVIDEIVGERFVVAAKTGVRPINSSPGVDLTYSDRHKL